MIIQTTAIVLRTVDFQESSKIVTLLTKSHGKLAVIAKGAKRPKSKFANLMETGNILDVVLYLKNNRSVQTISEASFKEKTFNIRYNFEKLALSTAVIEMIYQLLHENELNEPMYDFTEKFLVWLNKTDKNVHNLFPYLQLRLADLMGIGLQLDTPSLKNNLNKLYLEMGSGKISGNSENAEKRSLSAAQAHYLVLALQSNTSSVLDLPISNQEIKNLIRILDVYLKHHIDGLKDRTSDAIFEQML